MTAAQPFADAHEAWFWFVQAQEAKAAGARVRAGLGLVQRPCEPLDIYRLVDRLYRSRKLLRDHLHVMAHYGKRQSAPDPSRDREARAADLWREAFDKIRPLMEQKGIISVNGGDYVQTGEGRYPSGGKSSGPSSWLAGSDGGIAASVGRGTGRSC